MPILILILGVIGAWVAWGPMAALVWVCSMWFLYDGLRNGDWGTPEKWKDYVPDGMRK